MADEPTDLGVGTNLASCNKMRIERIACVSGHTVVAVVVRFLPFAHLQFKGDSEEGRGVHP